MKKKVVSALLCATMVATMFAGCGSKESDNNASTPDTSKADTSSEVSEPAEDTGKVLNIYCWNEEFKSRITAHYPDYKEVDATHGKIGDVDVVWNITPNDDNAYQNNLDATLLNQADAPADDKIDLFLVEADYALKYVDTDYTMPIKDLGITDDDLSKQYQYTKDIVTDSNGVLKGLSWQGCPGVLFYNRDAAKEVLGTDDPAKVQEALASWDKFFETAETLKAAGYKIVSGAPDVKYAIWDTQSQPWVTDDGSKETLTLDKSVTEYLETAKKIYDGEYSNNTSMWDNSWAADMKDDSKVFCYFGCPWFIGSMQGNGAVDGNWGAVTGPTSYHWGGTYVCVGKDTNNPELAAFLLYELTCDPDVGVEITNKTGDCVNNKEANARLIAGELSADNAAAKFLGGQNPIEVWAASAEGINLSNLTYQDASIKAFIDEASTAYNSGTYKSVDEAVKYIQDKCASELGISAE